MGQVDVDTTTRLTAPHIRASRRWRDTGHGAQGRPLPVCERSRHLAL